MKTKPKEMTQLGNTFFCTKKTDILTQECFLTETKNLQKRIALHDFFSVHLFAHAIRVQSRILEQHPILTKKRQILQKKGT